MEDDVLVAGSEESEEVESFLSRHALQLALGSTVVFVLYSVLVLDPTGKCFRLEEGSNSLGLTFSYSLQMVQEFFDLRSSSQLDCYREFLQIWDVIFAVIYTSMYCFWILFLFNGRRISLIIPILGMIADWAENITEILMINSYLDSDSISETVVSIGSGLNMIKWIMLMLTYLIILVGIFNKIKSSRDKSTQLLVE